MSGFSANEPQKRGRKASFLFTPRCGRYDADGAEDGEDDEGFLDMVDQPVRIACGSALGKDEGDDGYAQDLADEADRADNGRRRPIVFRRHRAHDGVIVRRREEGKADADDNQGQGDEPERREGNVDGQ